MNIKTLTNDSHLQSNIVNHSTSLLHQKGEKRRFSEYLYKNKLLFIWKAILKDLNLLAIAFGFEKTKTGKSSRDTKSYMWFKCKGRSWPANITLQYQQLNIEVLSLPFTEKSYIHQKDYTKIMHSFTQRTVCIREQIFLNYSASWLEKENYLFCSSSSSFLFIIATIAWRSSSKEKGQNQINFCMCFCSFQFQKSRT